MMSENSSFSNFVTLQKNIFKRRKWLIVLAFVTFILFDAGFLSLYLTGLTRSSAIDEAKEMLGAGKINTVIVLVGSVLLAIEGFHWLSNKQKIDFYESQPISRNAHFVGVIINSAVILVTSYLNGIVLGLIVAASYKACTGAVVKTAFTGFGSNLILSLATFSVSTLAVMLTGTLAVSVIAAVVLLAFEPAFDACVNTCLMMLPTYNGRDFTTHCIFSPVETVYRPAWYAIPHNLLCAAIALVAAYLFYRYRKNEDAGKTVPLKAVRAITKAALIFLAAIITGFFFEQRAGMAGGIISMIISALVVGGVMEAIYNADIRKVFKGLGFTAIGGICAIVLMVFCRYDVVGYSRWIPDKAGVKSAYIVNTSGNEIEDTTYAASYMKLTDIDTVNHLLEIGEETTRNTPGEYGSPANTCEIKIYYRMKNGKTMSRKVYIPATARDLMNKVMGSEEFKEGFFRLYHDDDIAKGLKRASASIAYDNEDAADATRLYANSTDIYQSLKEAYLKDLEHYDFDTVGFKMEIGQIVLDIPSEGGEEYLPVYASFSNTIQFLKDNHMYMDLPEKEVDRDLYSGFYTFPEKISY
ncbi:MAG: hypothetical protein II177_05780 [Lachnospiraceae bacterium]|nr:hypothetical protein [Lachnospiraceae bacterium]